MEVVEVPGHPGKLEVLFNHASISCFSDTDCPGAGICAINASWSLQPGGWCMCNTKYGLYGLECNEWCNQGVAIIICTIIAGVLEFFVAVAAFYYICLILWSHKFERIVSPVFVALVMVFLGSCLTLVGAIIVGVTISGFASHYQIVEDAVIASRFLKRSSRTLEFAGSIVSIIGYCLSMCAVVILPLTWVAQRSLKLRKTQTHLVICLSVAFAIVILAVMLTFYILAASNYQVAGVSWSLAGVIGWEVILVTVLFINFVAFVRITQLRRTATGNRNNSNEIAYSGQTSDDRINMNLLLRRIQIACGVLAIPLIMIMILMPFSYVRAQRGFYTDPRCYVDSYDILTRCSIFFVMLACAAVVWFVAPHARGLAKTAVAARQASTRAAHSREASRMSSSRYPPNTPADGGTNSRRDSKESKENGVDQSIRSDLPDNSVHGNGGNQESPPSSSTQRTPPNTPTVLKRRPTSTPLSSLAESKIGPNSSSRRVMFGDEQQQQQQQRQNGAHKSNTTTQSGTLTLT